MSEPILHETTALILSAMGNARRLQILEALSHSEMAVGVLASTIGLSPSATSQHLGRLRQAGLVIPRKQLHEVFYSLSSPQIMDLVTRAQHLPIRQRATPYGRKWA